MKIVDTEALALRSYNLVEASRIIVCFTPEHGIIRGVATGARRLRSQFGASFEPFTLIRLTYREKEGQELVALQSAEIQKSFFGLAGDERMTEGLGRFGRLLMEFATPSEPNQDLFRLTKACLFALEKDVTRLLPVVIYFEVWLLKLMGFMPEWSNCANCGNSLNPGPAWLETELSLACGNCKSGRGLHVSREVLELFRTVQRMAPDRFVFHDDQSVVAAAGDAFEITAYLINSVLAPKSIPRMRLGNAVISKENGAGQRNISVSSPE